MRTSGLDEMLTKWAGNSEFVVDKMRHKVNVGKTTM